MHNVHLRAIYLGSAISHVYVETGFICEQDIGPILFSESQMTYTPRQSSCTVHRQHNWTDCWTSWVDVTITKSIAYCYRADWS